MLEYPFNDIMIKVTTLFTKTKILQYFSEFLNFKTFSCPCPIMGWYCQFFFHLSSSSLAIWKSKHYLIYQSSSAKRNRKKDHGNCLVRFPLWDCFEPHGILEHVANTWWICPNPNSTFFIDLIWKLSLWINYLEILQSVVLDDLSCFCKLSFLDFFVNNVVPYIVSKFCKLLFHTKFWKLFLQLPFLKILQILFQTNFYKLYK